MRNFNFLPPESTECLRLWLAISGP
jgi:hypothetical protein